MIRSDEFSPYSISWIHAIYRTAPSEVGWLSAIGPLPLNWIATLFLTGFRGF